MSIFLSFGYPSIGEKFKTYMPEVQHYILETIPKASKETYRRELCIFCVAWLLRLYWVVMVAWFIYFEPSVRVQVLSIPLLICSLSLVLSLGLVLRSGSLLHSFFSVVGIITAGLMA